MALRYIIDAEPGQADALTRVMAEIGIKFDAQENLCAMPRDNVTEGIFQGNDLDWLPQKANELLEEEGNDLRFREDMDQAGDLQAQFDFLLLLSLDADYDVDHGGMFRDINSREMEKFREKHPAMMHRAGEQPAPLPPALKVLTDLRAPLFTRPVLGKLLETALVLLEDNLAEAAGLGSPNDGLEPATGLDEAISAAPGLRYILDGIHENYEPRDYMQDQFGDQIHTHAQDLLGLLDAADRDGLEELVGRVVRSGDRGQNWEERGISPGRSKPRASGDPPARTGNRSGDKGQTPRQRG